MEQRTIWTAAAVAAFVVVLVVIAFSLVRQAPSEMDGQSGTGDPDTSPTTEQSDTQPSTAG